MPPIHLDAGHVEEGQEEEHNDEPAAQDGRRCQTASPLRGRLGRETNHARPLQGTHQRSKEFQSLDEETHAKRN